MSNKHNALAICLAFGLLGLDSAGASRCKPYTTHSTLAPSQSGSASSTTASITITESSISSSVLASESTSEEASSTSSYESTEVSTTLSATIISSDSSSTALPDTSSTNSSSELSSTMTSTSTSSMTSSMAVSSTTTSSSTAPTPTAFRAYRPYDVRKDVTSDGSLGSGLYMQGGQPSIVLTIDGQGYLKKDGAESLYVCASASVRAAFTTSIPAPLSLCGAPGGTDESLFAHVKCGRPAPMDGTTSPIRLICSVDTCDGGGCLWKEWTASYDDGSPLYLSNWEANLDEDSWQTTLQIGVEWIPL